MGLRRVNLPGYIEGRLYLSELPGRNEPLAESLRAITERGIESVVCLVPFEEIERKSPEYARAVLRGLGFGWEHFPIVDFSAPREREAFLALARSLAERLKEGKRLLVHCSGGVGRSGTLAVSVLLAIGLEPGLAQDAVKRAGSQPETEAQKGIIRWVHGRTTGGGTKNR